MKRRRKSSPTRALAIQVFLAWAALGLIWLAYKLGIIEAFARALITPLDPTSN